MKKYLVLFLFLTVDLLFGQDFFGLYLWKLNGTNLVPVDQSWTVAGNDATTQTEIMEDFIGGNGAIVGALGWLKGGSITLSTITGEVGRIGVAKLLANSSGGNLYLTETNGAGAPYKANNPRLTYITSLKNTFAVNIEAILRFGLQDGQINNDPASGIYFRAVGTGNWYAVTRAINIETSTNCGIAQSTSYKQFKITSNSTGTSISFYIDGVLVATHTTNIPTDQLFPQYQIESTTLNNYGLDVDYFYLKVTGLTR